MKASLSRLFFRLERLGSAIAFFFLIFIPIFQLMRNFGLFSSVAVNKDMSVYISHALLWLVFLAAMRASLLHNHLSLVNIAQGFPSRIRHHFDLLIAVLSSTILFALAANSLFFVLQSIPPNATLGFLSKRFLLYIMPFSLAVMGTRAILYRGNPFSVVERAVLITIAILLASLLGSNAFYEYILYGMAQVKEDYIAESIFIFRPIAPFFFDFFDRLREGDLLFQLTETGMQFFQATKSFFGLFLIVLAFFGMPLFIVLGGIGFLLFASNGYNLSLPNQLYTMLSEQAPTVLPALPIFALVGYFLSESKSSERLVNFFSVLFAKIPGGVAFTTILVCAFFTAFSGASGITILAVGGLLLPPLKQYYSEKFSYGLLTSSGSIGLLFPPSLPLIMYAIQTSRVSFFEMLVAGIVPGAIIILLLIVYLLLFHRPKILAPVFYTRRERFLISFQATPEIFLPLFIIGLYFFVTPNLVIVSGLTFFYVLLTVLIRRDFTPRKMVHVMEEALPIIGGIFMILAMSKGLSDYFVDQGIPLKLKALVETTIESKYVFLFILNIALLVVGSFMDIFSAIIVVVPLLIPLAGLYDISLIHLGIIFLANLELGYMTPPVGMNLFLASYRFKVSLIKLYRSILPFFFVRLLIVFLITYIPLFSTYLPSLVREYLAK